MGFITIIEEDGLEIEVTERKTRTSIRTTDHEYDRVNRVNATQHITIDSDSPLLQDYVEDHGKALQILHHAVTYESKYV